MTCEDIAHDLDIDIDLCIQFYHTIYNAQDNSKDNHTTWEPENYFTGMKLRVIPL